MFKDIVREKSRVQREDVRGLGLNVMFVERAQAAASVRGCSG